MEAVNAHIDELRLTGRAVSELDFLWMAVQASAEHLAQRRAADYEATTPQRFAKATGALEFPGSQQRSKAIRFRWRAIEREVPKLKIAQSLPRRMYRSAPRTGAVPDPF